VYLKIKISDSGIGIKDEYMADLFDEFVQVDILKNRGMEGTGLGLAITKNLCTLMSGTIYVSSVYGEGSTFTVDIPQNYSEHEYKRFATVSIPDESNVLVYESREVYAESIKQELESLNVKCKVVANQSAFYDAIRNNDYSFIFFPAILMESVKNLIEVLGVASELVLLAEKSDEVITGNTKHLLMPVYSLQIANVLNDVCVESAYTENSNIQQFIAPSARILIVDDIDTNLMVAEGLMQQYQMQIDTCESGKGAIELIQKNSYDIVFMDHMMPVMDGIEATIAIRKFPRFHDLPVVALTANAISGVKEMFLSNGFNDFLAKPIEITKLNEMLDKWIPDEKKEKTAIKELTLTKPDFQIDGIDVFHGISMAGGSIEKYLEILSVFYKDGANKINEMKTCLENNNFALYTIHIHALKSALANIGANNLSNTAKVLELAGNTERIEFIKEYSLDFFQELDSLLINISYVIDTSNATSIDDISPDDLLPRLSKLKEAIAGMDAIATNEIINELQKSFRNDFLANRIEQISQHILLCEYDEAVSIINDLI
jgi:CheY-like chemotaxis protein